MGVYVSIHPHERTSEIKASLTHSPGSPTLSIDDCDIFFDHGTLRQAAELLNSMLEQMDNEQAHEDRLESHMDEILAGSRR